MSSLSIEVKNRGIPSVCAEPACSAPIVVPLLTGPRRNQSLSGQREFMKQFEAVARVVRSRMGSPYMEWAKLYSGARYNLALSGMPSLPFTELAALAGVHVEDLELSAPIVYGYEPLQRALAAKARVSPECVVAAAGTSMANHLAMAASFEPGDEVLVEQPVYEPLVSTALYLGGKVRRFARRPEDGFRIDPREVEQALSPRTRLIVVTNLHNPSSAMADETTLRAVGNLAESVGARVLVDEVYLEAVFSTPWRPAFHLGSHFIATGSLTKAYGLGGLRCGWALAEAPLAKSMWRLNDLYAAYAAHPAERLSEMALKHLPALAARSQALLEPNRKIINSFLDSRSDLEITSQPFGTVIFPQLRKGNVEGFCRLLREKYDTSVVPGRFFEAPEHIRIFVGAETATLTEGLERIATALNEY